MIYYQIGDDYQVSQAGNLEGIIPEAARKLLLPGSITRLFCPRNRAAVLFPDKQE